MEAKKQTLYDINSEQLELINIITEAGGELTPELESRLLINEKDRNQKSIAYLEVISGATARLSMIDDEIKRLTQMKKVHNNIKDRLEANLLLAVKTFGTYEVGLQKFGTRKSSTLEVEESEINFLPKKYLVRKVTESPDKKLLKEALQNGEEIKGVSIKEHLNLKIN